MTQQWADEELAEFDSLIDMLSSRDQLERISGRLAMSKFVAQHGKEKCDAMFAYLESKGKK
jgi:hypothetical protein